MSRANDTGSPSLPSPQGGPSRELQAREVEGLIRFLAAPPVEESGRLPACTPQQELRRRRILEELAASKDLFAEVGDEYLSVIGLRKARPTRFGGTG